MSNAPEISRQNWTLSEASEEPLEARHLGQSVALELDVDDRRERVADRLLGDDRDVGGDRPAGAKLAETARHGRGRQADPFGQQVGGELVVRLQAGEELEVERIELVVHRGVFPAELATNCGAYRMFA